MGRKSWKVTRKKKTVCAGLFLVICLANAGCVKPTVNPEVTNAPVASVTESVKPTPEQESSPGGPTPSVTEPVVKPTAAPTAELIPEPTAIPEVIPTFPVTPTESPEVTSEAMVTLQPSEEVTGTPVVLPEVSPEPTVTPEPFPTAVPEYETLLQNGWQRTEDFFGCREIFFSGKFDDAEPVIGEGCYEFSYRSVSDVSVLFRIIGEEGAGVEPFLETLRHNRPECVIEQEGPDDYSYTYVDGRTQVKGRIYACGEGENENRTRVEFYSPAGSDIQTEGYGFYLR